MNTFEKDEKLCSKTLINAVFAEGQSIFVHPVKLIWLKAPLNTKFPAQVVISVPKRFFKKAVDRNRIKRQIREIYRLNKQSLYDHLKSTGEKLALVIIYAAKTPCEYKELESKIILTLQRFIKEQSTNVK